MFRCSAIFPILLSLAAFILALLSLLAGRDTGFMNDVYILRVCSPLILVLLVLVLVVVLL